jgi:hypothetical protein
MRIASESVADNELCPFNALASALTAGRRMTSHMDMLLRSNTGMYADEFHSIIISTLSRASISL